MRIAVLTSSRADFGIYLPLLKGLRDDAFFKLELIVFGSHLSRLHGYTIVEIEGCGFKCHHRINSLLADDAPESISSAYGLTALKFADFWQCHSRRFDCVICLGDRFEMAAAVTSGIPFGIPFVHMYGGEKTLGAIDNIYRDVITLSSRLHLVATEEYRKRIAELTGRSDNCFVVGSTSLDNLEEFPFLTLEEFYSSWGIDLRVPTILVTVHPETVAYESNVSYADELIKALTVLAEERQIVITMPNADTNGMLYRSGFHRLQGLRPKSVHLIESFGKTAYFTCMKHACHLIGNTSSGIIEAASFKKYVINLGERQAGRLRSGNVVDVPFRSEAIVNASKHTGGKSFSGNNLYAKSQPVRIIIDTLKFIYAKAQ